MGRHRTWETVHMVDRGAWCEFENRGMGIRMHVVPVGAKWNTDGKLQEEDIDSFASPQHRYQAPESIGKFFAEVPPKIRWPDL